MSVRLNVGDAVLVHTDPESERIGQIKYIGCIHGCDMTTEYVGIELTESIHNGHTGTIAGYQYFSSPKGHGFHTKLASVIRKMVPSELVTQLRDALTAFKKKLSEKEKYIERLESKISITNARFSHPHHMHYDIAGSSKRTSLVSGASGYLPRRESLSLTTITESFMIGNRGRNSKRESALDVIDEAKKRRQLKNRTHKRRTSKSTKKNQSTVTTPTAASCDHLSDHLSDHECTSSDSGYSSSSSEYTDVSLTDEEFSTSMNTMKQRASPQQSFTRASSQQSIHNDKKADKKLKKMRQNVRSRMRDKVNVLKDRKQLRRISDSVTNSLFQRPAIAMGPPPRTRNNNSLSRQESMVKTTTNVQQIRSNRIAHHHSVTAYDTSNHHNNHQNTAMSPHDTSLPPAHPVLMRPSSSPVFTTGSKNTATPHTRFNSKNLAPNQHPNSRNAVLLDPPTSPSHTNATVPTLRNQSSGFVDVCYIHENSLSPTFYGSSSHNNHQSSHSFNQFVGMHPMQSSHSNQSSTTITVPSQIDLWSNPHSHHHQGSSTTSPLSPTSMTPRTPQHADTGTMQSETQTAYFDPESFLNQRNQMLIQQQQQQQQQHQIPSYNVVSIKYNQSHHAQTQSQKGLSLKATLSAARTGARTNVQSVRTSPTRTTHTIASPSAAASNVALYGDSHSNNTNAHHYAHHNKIYSMPNGGFHRLPSHRYSK